MIRQLADFIRKLILDSDSFEWQVGAHSTFTPGTGVYE
jgi:hypothetical protein